MPPIVLTAEAPAPSKDEGESDVAGTWKALPPGDGEELRRRFWRGNLQQGPGVPAMATEEAVYNFTGADGAGVAR